MVNKLILGLFVIASSTLGFAEESIETELQNVSITCVIGGQQGVVAISESDQRVWTSEKAYAPGIKGFEARNVVIENTPLGYKMNFEFELMILQPDADIIKVSAENVVLGKPSTFICADYHDGVLVDTIEASVVCNKL